MTRTLRGAWSRRGTLLTLLAMTAVVVGGAVGVLGFAEAAGTSPWLTAPLLLVGAVAIPSIGRELAASRREEIGLARLRGIRGARLGSILLLEPLVTILVGTVSGFALGSLIARAAGSAWLDAGPPELGSAAIAVALATAAGGLVIVLVASWTTVGEPLSAQVATGTRPRRATTARVFASVLVVVGAVVAVQSNLQGGFQGRQTPDALVLVGPALVGLALGEMAVWALRLVSRAATGATATSGLSAFLATRRLSRADDLVTPMRLLVAAAVVGVLALSGASSVTAWVDGESRIVAGGPRMVPVDNGAVQAMALSRGLDPEGEHLMAISVVPNEQRLAERRAYVDAARFAAVAGDFYSDTPAAAAAAAVPELATPAPDLAFTGGRFRVSGRLLESTTDVTTGITVRLDFVTAEDTGSSVEVELSLPTDGAPADAVARVSGCASGCQVTGLAIDRILRDGAVNVFGFDPSPYRVLLSEISVGDQQLASAAWLPERRAIEQAQADRFAPNSLDLDRRALANRPDGLEVQPLPNSDLPLTLQDASTPTPVLVAGAAPTPPLDVSGDDRVLGAVTRLDALPLLGTVGQLTDLPTSMVGSGSTVPSARTAIVVGADAPDALVAQLTDATGTSALSLDDVRRSVGAAAGVDQARAYALMAAFCGLVALIALAAGVARHQRAYRRDVAALRVLGVGLADARRAGRLEVATLAAIVLVAVAIGGLVAVLLLLDGLPLIDVSEAGLPLDHDPTLPGVVLPAALAALAMLILGGRARGVRPDATRPSTLREEEGR